MACAKQRAQIVASVPVCVPETSYHHAQTPPASVPARMSWARLLKRVFDIDVERCPRCGGRLKIIAAVVDPQLIVQILTHGKAPEYAPMDHSAATTESASAA